MATRTTRTLSVQLRLVATEHEFSDDETPSLPPMPVVDTTGEDVTHAIRCAGLAKCGPVAIERRRVGR